MPITSPLWPVIARRRSLGSMDEALSLRLSHVEEGRIEWMRKA